MSIDERWLQYCRTPNQEKVVRAVLECANQKSAAEKIGINIRSLERSLQKVRGYACELDDHLLPIERQTNVRRDEDGKIVGYDKTRVADLTTIQLFEEMKAGIDCKLARPKKMPKGVKKDLCSVLTIADPHIGMLAYGVETGGQNYNTQIAIDRLTIAIDDLLPAGHKVKHGVLLNLGDLIHFDGLRAVTPQSGNILDTDSRYGHICRSAVAIIRYAIDRMLEHCDTVEIMNVRGNHDESSLLWLNILCQHVYANEPRVLPIQDNDNKVLTHKWEKNFIYAYHGDGLKPQAAYNVATRDYAQEFADCRYIWMPSGHLHNEQIKWIGKAKLEVVASLSEVDSWHASKGYGSNREMVRTDLKPSGGRAGGGFHDPYDHDLELIAA